MAVQWSSFHEPVKFFLRIAGFSISGIEALLVQWQFETQQSVDGFDPAGRGQATP